MPSATTPPPNSSPTSTKSANQRQLIRTSQFRKDYKRAVKRGWDTAKIGAIVDALATDKPLPPNARPHKLSGEYQDAWDVHIAPDWVLIYEINTDTLKLRRTGTHSDLF